MIIDVDELRIAVVQHLDTTYTVADYPLTHLSALLAEYDGDLAEVVDRLQCDGWTPADIAAGAAR